MNKRDHEMLEAISLIEDEEDESLGFSVQPPRSPSQVYSIRIPVERVEQLRKLAASRGVAPTKLIRDWVVERLDLANTVDRRSSRRTMRFTSQTTSASVIDLERIRRVSA